jgi:hypothetical protein
VAGQLALPAAEGGLVAEELARQLLDVILGMQCA